MTPARAHLTRERVLRAAVSFADENGIASLTMRKLGRELGVEAMSLYHHVANKDDLLDGVVEFVVGEFALPSDEEPWMDALRETAVSVRRVLLRHPWAAPLVESRVTPSGVRFRYSEAVIRALRQAGFSTELAFRAQLTISSFIYGFVLQEVSWPFEPNDLPEVAAALQPRVTVEEHPYLLEMMGWLMESRFAAADGHRQAAHFDPEFGFGLDRVLEALERARQDISPTP